MERPFQESAWQTPLITDEPTEKIIKSHLYLKDWQSTEKK